MTYTIHPDDLELGARKLAKALLPNLADRSKVRSLADMISVAVMEWAEGESEFEVGEECGRCLAQEALGAPEATLCAEHSEAEAEGR